MTANNKLSGKKLLILGGATAHVKVVRAAKELGVYTIVTDFLEPEDSPAKLIADEYWMLNVTDVEGLAKKCKEEHVDGIINFCIDISQRPHQKLCEMLNLPCYGSDKQFKILTDKTAFINFCKECGVDVIPQYTEQEIADNKVDYPIFIKPVDSRGSRGQSICYNKDEALTAIEFAKNESSNGNVIIEKYMAGHQDFSMSYTVKDGVPYLTRTGNRYLGEEKDKLNKQAIAGISPSSNTEMYLNNVDKRICNFIKKLGIKNGPVFMQGFIDGNTVRFYDPGLRYPGTDYEKLLKEAIGLDVMKMIVSYAVTGKMGCFGELDGAYKLNGKISAQLYISARPGTIAVYEGLEEIAKNPYIVTVGNRKKVGDEVPATGDVRQRLAEVVILAPNKDEARKTIEYVYDTFKVLDENGNDMIVSKFDTSKL